MLIEREPGPDEEEGSRPSLWPLPPMAAPSLWPLPPTKTAARPLPPMGTAARPVPPPVTAGRPLPPPRPRPIQVYRGLPLPVRLVGWIALSLLVGVILGSTAPTALRRIGAVAAMQPGLLAWYSVRALGFMAYGVLAASVLYGLLLSTKILDAIAHRPVTFALHQDLAAIGLGLAAVHVVLLGLDATQPLGFAEMLVPFASPYRPVWVGMGQLGLYLVATVTASFYLRRRIGQRSWRLLHYVTFLAFAFTTAHGIMSGTDTSTPWAWWVYVVATTVVVFLTVYRIAESVLTRRERRGPAAEALGPLELRSPSRAGTAGS
jgi:DMSO/TMAO reductase YedYZ heme-binding membrane subunit